MRKASKLQADGLTTAVPSIPTVHYDIFDRHGQLVARHARQDLANGEKKVWWEQPDGTPGLAGRKVQNLPLYGLPKLLAARPGSRIIVCEGEKAAEALLSLGILAVGTVTGARTIPADQVLRPLLDYDVILWPDNDDIGRQHMSKLAAALRRLAEDAD